MLSNVRHKRGRDDRGLGVLPDAGRNQRVLHHRHVHRNVRLMVLVEERFNRVTLEERHVLGHRVAGFLVVRQGHKLVRVLDAENLQHVAVQLGHVVDVRGGLGHLHDRLILDDPLAHGGRVGVTDRNHIHMVVVFLLGGCAPNVGLVVVRWLRVVTDDCRQQPQLLLERVVQSGLNRRHNLELALQQGQCRAHRRLSRHVANLHVRRGREPTTFLNNVVEQRVQNLAGLLVRQGQDVVAQRTGADVYVTELTRLDGGIVSLDAQATGLQTTGQVGQRTGIHQLAHDAGGALGKPADEVEQPEAVRTKTGDVLVVHEVLALQFEFVVL